MVQTNHWKKTRYYDSNKYCVATHANYEYQTDVCFVTDLEDQSYKIGMSSIDMFTRPVVPIRTKQPTDVIAGLMECLNHMKHKSNVIYNDNEGSINSQDVCGYLEKQHNTCSYNT